MTNAVKISLLSCAMLMFSCNKEKTIDDELKEAAASMNKLTPQNLSESVRLDSVSVEPNKVFKYNYTLTNDVKENVSASEIKAFKSQAKEGAVKAVKSSAEMKEFRDNNVTLKYVYYDKNGKPTADYIIQPSEYK